MVNLTLRILGERLIQRKGESVYGRTLTGTIRNRVAPFLRRLPHYQNLSSGRRGSIEQHHYFLQHRCPKRGAFAHAVAFLLGEDFDYNYFGLPANYVAQRLDPAIARSSSFIGR